MKCPVCSSNKTGCKDSRWRPTYNVIRRRRVCFDCGHLWSTQEVVVPDGARNMVVVSAAQMAQVQEIATNALARGNCLNENGFIVALKKDEAA